MPSLSLAGFSSGDYQDGAEAALHDQVLLSQTMEATYLKTDSIFQQKLLSGFFLNNSDRYISFLGQYTFGGNHLVYCTQYPSLEQEQLDARIQNINNAIDNYPQLNFYLFYIEKETDVDLRTGEKTGFSDAILPAVSLPKTNKDVFEVNNFADFDRWFFKTDHHWNCYGSYLGYLQTLRMLQPGSTPVQILDERTLNYPFSGSKATMTGAKDVFCESFPAYVYDYLPMTVTINGEQASDYGNQGIYLDGTTDSDISYGAYYGADDAEIIFDTELENMGKLLVLGESYDNAILKLLACHYSQLYSIDLRFYAQEFGHSFSLEEYCNEHEIDTVLLIGNLDYYASDVFNVEG